MYPEINAQSLSRLQCGTSERSWTYFRIRVLPPTDSTSGGRRPQRRVWQWFQKRPTLCARTDSPVQRTSLPPDERRGHHFFSATSRWQSSAKAHRGAKARVIMGVRANQCRHLGSQDVRFADNSCLLLICDVPSNIPAERSLAEQLRPAIFRRYVQN